MVHSIRTPPTHAQSIDWLFAQLPGDELEPGVSPRSFHAASLLTETGPPDDPNLIEPPAMSLVRPPPALFHPNDLSAAYEWLQTERKRLEEYTRSQFEMIRQQHQAVLSKHFRSEEALALRAQELNREMQYLAAHAVTLQERARELADREATLAEQVDKLSKAQADLAAVQQTGDGAANATAIQSALLAELRAETARLQESDAAARQQFEGFEAELRERQQAWEKKQAEITARVAEMEHRYQALERTEEAARRRMAELDEWEERLRQEFERQEQQLVRERRENEALCAQLRSDTVQREAGRGPLAGYEASLRAQQLAWEQRHAEMLTRQAQMERRYVALQQAEEAVKRWQAEVEEWEDRLGRELEEQEKQLAAERRDLEVVRKRLRQGTEPSVHRNGNGTLTAKERNGG